MEDWEAEDSISGTTTEQKVKEGKECDVERNGELEMRQVGRTETSEAGAEVRGRVREPVWERAGKKADEGKEGCNAEEKGTKGKEKKVSLRTPYMMRVRGSGGLNARNVKGQRKLVKQSTGEGQVRSVAMEGSNMKSEGRNIRENQPKKERNDGRM